AQASPLRSSRPPEQPIRSPRRRRGGISLPEIAKRNVTTWVYRVKGPSFAVHPASTPRFAPGSISRPGTPRGTPLRSPQRPAGPAGSGTGGAVQAKTDGCRVATGPGALEADGDAPAWADRAVIAGVGRGDVAAALADGRVPRVGDPLVTREVP